MLSSFRNHANHLNTLPHRITELEDPKRFSKLAKMYLKKPEGVPKIIPKPTPKPPRARLRPNPTQHSSLSNAGEPINPSRPNPTSSDPVKPAIISLSTLQLPSRPTIPDTWPSSQMEYNTGASKLPIQPVEPANISLRTHQLPPRQTSPHIWTSSQTECLH